MTVQRENIPFDVLFVGGGPANLSGAIRLMTLANEKGMELEVALIEKGAEIGSHAVSGAILNPRALQELIPDYEDQGFPGETTVRGDAFVFLTKDKSFRMPIIPRYIHNDGFQRSRQRTRLLALFGRQRECHRPASTRLLRRT